MSEKIASGSHLQELEGEEWEVFRKGSALYHDGIVLPILEIITYQTFLKDFAEKFII
ncbi:hypothetical protein Avbf_01257 [Armadillidium vulgare]|nr:hypothetical protein Avbf_01257 [Armadillidium vulgare]